MQYEYLSVCVDQELWLWCVIEGLPKGRLVLVPFKNVLLVLSCGCFYRLDGFNLLRNGCRDRINSIEAIGQHKMKKLGVLSLRWPKFERSFQVYQVGSLLYAFQMESNVSIIFSIHFIFRWMLHLQCCEIFFFNNGHLTLIVVVFSPFVGCDIQCPFCCLQSIIFFTVSAVSILPVCEYIED